MSDLPTGANLYHYCSTQTFLKILTGNSIRLCSLSLSNDTREGKLVQATILEMARAQNMPLYRLERLRESLNLIGSIVDGLGFCLSEEHDLLSQWRGYADDGRGVAIGFSVDYLKALSLKRVQEQAVSFELAQVSYDPEEHQELVEPVYRQVVKEIEAGAFDSPGLSALALGIRTDEDRREDEARRKAARERLNDALFSLLFDLFKVKGRAFSEEKEWRLLSHMVRSPEDSCEYHATSARITPFREFEFEPLLGVVPVGHVVLGPKHETPTDVVAEFLRRNGRGDVFVEQSAATYR